MSVCKKDFDALLCVGRSPHRFAPSSPQAALSPGQSSPSLNMGTAGPLSPSCPARQRVVWLAASVGTSVAGGAGWSRALLPAEVLGVISRESRGQGPCISPELTPSASSPAFCLCCSATAYPAPPEAPREAPDLSVSFLDSLRGSRCFSAALFLPGLLPAPCRTERS